jgi:hypothetical protein
MSEVSEVSEVSDCLNSVARFPCTIPFIALSALTAVPQNMIARGLLSLPG